MPSHVRSCFLASLFVAAMPAVAGNLVSDPDFSQSSSGGTAWSEFFGSIEVDFSHGSPAAPSLRVSGTEDSPLRAGGIASSCIEIDDSAHIDFSFRAFVIAGSASGSVLAYSDGACTELVDSIWTGSTSMYPSGEWTTLSLIDAALPAGTQSVQVAIDATSLAFGSGSVGTPGDAYFDHVVFGPAGTIPGKINVNQEGLSGAWYDPAQVAQGFQFAITAASGGDQGSLFGTWYTYDTVSGGADTQRWYSIDAVLTGDAASAEVTIYQNTGGNFAAPPATTAIPVGTGTLSFDSCSSGEFAYAFDDGRTGSIPLQLLVPMGYCDETGNPSVAMGNSGLSGAWYDPATGGQGLMIDVNDPADFTFAGWYTYALDGIAITAKGQRWFSLQGGRGSGHSPISLILAESTGGAFATGGPATTIQVGTATLTFASCWQATLDYEFTDGDLAGVRGTLDLTRLGATPKNCSLADH
jgi:hypothetical protein